MASPIIYQAEIGSERGCCASVPAAAKAVAATAGSSSCAGIPWDDRLWDGTWAAIKRVWASKWGERAAGGLRGAGVAQRDLRMAVLVQRVVPARYAFVAHTVHPTAGKISASGTTLRN